MHGDSGNDSEKMLDYVCINGKGLDEGIKSMIIKKVR